MSSEHEYESWEDWNDEELEDELLEDLSEDDDFFEDEDDAIDPLADGPLAGRMRWFQARGGIPGTIDSDDILDFHFFIDGTRGVCKGERNFFNRMKLYFYHDN